MCSGGIKTENASQHAQLFLSIQLSILASIIHSFINNKSARFYFSRTFISGCGSLLLFDMIDMNDVMKLLSNKFQRSWAINNNKCTDWMRRRVEKMEECCFRRTAISSKCWHKFYLFLVFWNVYTIYMDTFYHTNAVNH